ncbi:isocitrate lyase/PEP mutase family protein [Thermorudis peleae]|uniref:isocitrate lyase/PEP mutase family protein n=1 Tax=Thermorudis peleae TaxID=1382356 RepID=UPI000691E3C7|nr:isocitrate lyase/PEP mutase family protein [Thermorudis peleae]
MDHRLLPMPDEPVELVETPLLPPGYRVPSSRWEQPSTRLRRLLATLPYVFAPGVYDPHGAELVMYYQFPAVYFSGYSFAIGHLGTTDMDLYTGVEIADAARRVVMALRKFQLTMAVGDPDKGIPPRHLHIPPVVVDMDTGYGNVFNVQRIAELYVTAGVAGAHIEDQVMPKRCGHIVGKALIPIEEMLGKLKMLRAVADDLGNRDFVIIARTDAVSAVDAPEGRGGLDCAINRALRYLDSGIPDLVWCEFPTAERGPTERFAEEVRKRFPDAQLAFNWSSSFKWFTEPNPLTFAELGEMGFRFIFITLAAQHAMGAGFSRLLQGLAHEQEQAYIALQREEWAEELPTRSHHLFTGVPYHQLTGECYAAPRLGRNVGEKPPEEAVV